MKVVCIYLAAGNSRRFGSNKLLYPIEGKPMYRHVLDRLSAVCQRHTDWEVLAVTQYPELTEEIAGTGVGVVFSPDSCKGISYSIKAALAAIKEADAYAFFVADQPYLTEETIEAFLTEMERQRCPLGCVCHRGQSGNPVWFAEEFTYKLLALTGDRGGKSILKENASSVCFFEVAGAKELRDIDSL